MQNILQGIPITYEFFPAVYGKEIKNIDEVYDEKESLRILKRKLNMGEIGCALSHRLIYKKMIDENISQALILEDDVSLLPDFYPVYRALSGKCIGNKVILLGTTVTKRMKKIWKEKLTDTHSMYLVLNNYPGTYGYVIGLDAAKKIYYHKTINFEGGPKMIKKKIFGLAISSIMALSLAACGSSNNETTAGNASQNGETSAAASQNSGDGSKITVAIWDNGQKPGLQEIINDFTAETGYQAELQVITWDQYWTLLEAGASGGDMPDVITKIHGK